ncbi:MAG: Gfo/Idh/MocA family oxidoreductase [Candidatus Omnitrophica bacterium]|nr:Gfo/Idh/MocA family oxidoreductase [Candidatus Omnitrophota bacterium]
MSGDLEIRNGAASSSRSHHLISPSVKPDRLLSSADLAQALARKNFANCRVTLLGFGTMGRAYLQTLQRLGVGQIRVCSRSGVGFEELQGIPGIKTVTGGFEQLKESAQPGELGIVATPTASLAEAAESLAQLHFDRLLIEKPVALSAEPIERLDRRLQGQGVEVFCAFNRIAYPSLIELRSRLLQEGPITSCAYTFTEIIKPDWPQRFPAEELARWGIANSLHVLSMAHRLIGMPVRWSGYRAGSLPWHPSGAVFVGSGVSERDVPFGYHADWGSTGRWSVELHTPAASYRFCPLERLTKRISPGSDWEECPVAVLAPELKTGLAEQVAALLSPDLRSTVPLMKLSDTAALTRFGEEIFGYAAKEVPVEEAQHAS